ncbi:MAG: hypothetical protein H0A76_04970 [Candidatus Thiodubiliella endoseptemdiera]|uniref:Uncharacterized protein n=1 Tax=Candidatus Thiodubiliella endoseptemdiera TaxID=2738886 RepID=A0A853F3Y3_9GAMM|nr:hypothetical protein [Candidatus Thiodubiliella endoseptemdiera]
MDEEFGIQFQKAVKLINVFVGETAYLSLDELSNLDPNIDKMAQTVKLFADFLKIIASEPFYDENKATNIFQCSLIMERMAIAVKGEDLEEFKRLSTELKNHAQY